MKVYLLVQVDYDYEEIWEYYKFYGVFSSRKKCLAKAKSLKLDDYHILVKKVDDDSFCR